MGIRPLDDHTALEALFAGVAATDGREPLSDHKHLALSRGEGITLVADCDGTIGAMAQIMVGQSEATIEIVVEPGRRSVAFAGDMLDAALAAAAPLPSALVWAFDPDQVEAVESRGGRLTRQIAQLRRPLPPDRLPDLPTGITVRPFVPGTDEDALLAVNNEAFAGHPENGGWDRAVLTERMAQDWFDPDGLLMAWDATGAAGFCWTKLHPGSVGEIYVIAVAGRAGGRGLGRELARAGLWDLSDRRGAETAMLYAEVDNVRGRAMYRSLGFTVARIDSCYRVAVPTAG